jgi:hypothetical protein
MAQVNNIVMGGAQVYITGSVGDFDSATGTQEDNGFVGNTAATVTFPWKSYVTGGGNVGKSVLDSTSVGGIFGGYTGNGETLVDLGYTSEGIDLSFEPEYTDVPVDQLLDSAIIFKTSQRVSFGTTLTEATLTNLARAIGQDESKIDVTDGWNGAGDEKILGIEAGSLGSFPRERGILAVANGPRTGNAQKSERVFEAYRAVSVESVGVAVKRNEVTSFPVTFRCLPEAGGDYMRIADRVY